MSMHGMETQYLFNMEVFKNELVPDCYKKLIQPPIRIALNKDTIFDCVSSILKTYSEQPQKKYTKIKNSLFWGFAHDGILKLGMDFLGIFIQGTDEETVEPITAPHRLLHIKGGTQELIWHTT